MGTNGDPKEPETTTEEIVPDPTGKAFLSFLYGAKNWGFGIRDPRLFEGVTKATKNVLGGIGEGIEDVLSDVPEILPKVLENQKQLNEKKRTEDRFKRYLMVGTIAGALIISGTIFYLRRRV